jgi:hypothetical protein
MKRMSLVRISLLPLVGICQKKKKKKNSLCFHYLSFAWFRGKKKLLVTWFIHAVVGRTQCNIVCP